MYDEGCLVIGRLVIPEGTKDPHDEDGLGFGTGMRLSYMVSQ